MWPLAFAVASLLAGTPVFERVEPLELRTGVMHLRTVEAPLLEVPDLADREGSTWREDRFSRLYVIEFDLETRHREHPELEDRGALLVGVRTTSDDLVALDERIRALLASLGADGFAAPLAGIREGTPSFLDLAAVSVEPSWICAIGGDRGAMGSTTVYYRQTEKLSDGQERVVGTSSARSSVPEHARRICDAFRLAAQGAMPEEIRTLPAPRQLRELRLEVEEASTLPKGLRREDLTPLPPGIQFSKKKAPGASGGGSYATDGSRSTYIDREVEWTAVAPPVALSLDLLARGVHVSRWTIVERERRVGVSPRAETRALAVRTVGFVPIQPAQVEDEAPASSFPVELNTELLKEDVAHVLDAGSDVDGAALEGALRGGHAMGPQWLRSESWLMVVCREDGTAWYGLPPTGARSTVTNAPLFCAAMERMLP